MNINNGWQSLEDRPRATHHTIKYKIVNEVDIPRDRYLICKFADFLVILTAKVLFNTQSLIQHHSSESSLLTSVTQMFPFPLTPSTSGTAYLKPVYSQSFKYLSH